MVEPRREDRAAWDVKTSREQLALAAQRGALAAFTSLVAIFEGRLFNFLLRRVGRRADAEDLTQEAFVRAWEQIARYDPRWRFSTWLFTIASRLVISNHRRRRTTLHLSAADQTLSATPNPARSSSEAGVLGDRLWKLAEDVLSDDQHTALWLRYVEDLSIAEVATVLGKTQVGVRVTLFRARQLLHQHLEASAEGPVIRSNGAAANVTDDPRTVRIRVIRDFIF